MRELRSKLEQNLGWIILALLLGGPESTVVELSWYGDASAELALGGAFHSQRLTLRSSQVGGLPAPQRARSDPR